MGITTQTKNALYAKSGNQCAYPGCNQILINDGINNSNICHIVSDKPKGPRHRSNIDYDNEENLILLCRNHHNEVDTNVQEYSESILHNMKNIHERLIWTLVDNNIEFNELKGILLKAMDNYDIIDIIENEDYLVSFPEYKLTSISNFASDIDRKILTACNNNFANSEFMSSMRTLSVNLNELSKYLYNNTKISDDGKVFKVEKYNPLNSEHINTLRKIIANELGKYIQ